MLSGTAWFAPIWIGGLGVAISLTARVGSSTGDRVLTGLAFSLLIFGSMVVHQLGGIVAGRLVGAPMLAVIFTGTLAYDVYRESNDYSRSVHIVRALGGPAANAALGVIMLAVHFGVVRNPFVVFVGFLNLLFVLAALMPLPTMDGGVILARLRESERDASSSEDRTR